MKYFTHNEKYRMPEDELGGKLVVACGLNKQDRDKILDDANILLKTLNDGNYILQLMKAYNLSQPEGMALMTLCEALLRTPDVKTQDKLIKEKLTRSQWDHISENSFYATVAGVALTRAKTFAMFDTMVTRLSWPVVRKMTKEAVKLMGQMFVMGETVKKAIAKKQKHYSYSFDMLGEAATNWDDANAYYEKYIDAAIEFKDSISVKLSAIHPKYEYRNYQDVLSKVVPKLAAIARICEENNTTMTIDAEETSRLDLSIMVLEELVSNYRFKNNTIGFAIQAYQKRAFWVCDTIEKIAKDSQATITVRLVKGAYWDTEIKIAQQDGLDYPVFTKKELTDISYIACAKKLLKSQHIFPAFATHNPFTVAAIYHCNETLGGEFEFQKLYGMGDSLFSIIKEERDTNVRVYAPVGPYEDLLAYLVRRLLENGANTSFVYNLEVSDPFINAKCVDCVTPIPSWKELYNDRINSKGYDLTDPEHIMSLLDTPEYAVFLEDTLDTGDAIDILSNSDWRNIPFEKRKELVLKYADNLQDQMVPAANNLVHYAYKTYPNAIAEVREAIDFIRYYANIAEKLFNEHESVGYTGEYNNTEFQPRGTWMVIAPWNFPLAIFVGPIISALLTGNSVLAKSAPQTQKIAEATISCMYASGIPTSALRLCDPSIEEATVALKDERIRGVTFTGSHTSAKQIQRTLAERDGEIIPFIAETGGINCTIADSSCLPEQLIKDTVHGAFDSAGQRCSATRFLFLQKDNADVVIKMLKGSIQLLDIGHPGDLNTDVSRVIDGNAYAKIQSRLAILEEKETLIAKQTRMNEDVPNLIIPPSAYLVNDYREYFSEEIFGPVLHVYVYEEHQIDDIIDFINNSRFGLTLGIHSRVSSFHEYVSSRINVGNIYVNRDQIGAVVETQPFGGVGLSGTGPKAGGPNYLLPYVWEKHVSINTTAIGGNTVLLSSK